MTKQNTQSGEPKSTFSERDKSIEIDKRNYFFVPDMDIYVARKLEFHDSWVDSHRRLYGKRAHMMTPDELTTFFSKYLHGKEVFDGLRDKILEKDLQETVNEINGCGPIKSKGEFIDSMLVFERYGWFLYNNHIPNRENPEDWKSNRYKFPIDFYEQNISDECRIGLDKKLMELEFPWDQEKIMKKLKPMQSFVGILTHGKPTLGIAYTHPNLKKGTIGTRAVYDANTFELLEPKT